MECNVCIGGTCNKPRRSEQYLKPVQVETPTQQQHPGADIDGEMILLNPHGLVTGATYTDVAIHIPALWILVILSGILGVLLIAIRWTRSYLKYVPVMGALLIAVAILGRFILPNLAQQFSVDPNELRLEAPYLEKNIEMTRLAYNLQDARVVEYIPTDRLNIRDIRNNQDAVDNIRLWDPRLLIGAYKQLQEIRSYYEFYTIDNDRRSEEHTSELQSRG